MIENVRKYPLIAYPLSDRLWIQEYPVRFGGARFNARMTVIRLDSGRLVVHSPGPIDDATFGAISALGEVGWLLAPGNLHHIHVAAAQERFPNAKTAVCPGVEKRQPKLSFDVVLTGDAETPWQDELPFVYIGGARFICEVALFHRHSRTLILTDVIEYIDQHTAGTDWVLRLYWQVLGMWGRPKPAPEYRMSWKDKEQARSALNRVLEWDFESIILAHGNLVQEGARDVAMRAWASILR